MEIFKKRIPGGQVDILERSFKVRHIFISQQLWEDLQALWFGLQSTGKNATSMMPV
ncbi:hypothetical protein NG798_24750 [Ancylothrix sp. C2]|uniref:hypothetical protein n=1 Tax=Ancylothrix sp. D3o TaxID=2953691 RepID=UPI0021BAF500|nr:hypothetical protein [Ancylothrix sp. D3o]MCT7953012.1 hypothetical protein [Ancylothrix sp. D3o]